MLETEKISRITSILSDRFGAIIGTSIVDRNLAKFNKKPEQLTTAEYAELLQNIIKLIIKPIFGLPVQLFRAACAVTAAIASFNLLDVFKI